MNLGRMRKVEGGLLRYLMGTEQENEYAFEVGKGDVPGGDGVVVTQGQRPYLRPYTCSYYYKNKNKLIIIRVRY